MTPLDAARVNRTIFHNHSVSVFIKKYSYYIRAVCSFMGYVSLLRTWYYFAATILGDAVPQYREAFT